MIKKAIAILLLIFAIIWSFKALMPSKISNLDTEKSKFSTARALVHLDNLSKAPHGIGTDAHTEVRNYIIAELKKLGLETQTQKGFSISKWGNLAHPTNILTRIKGTQPGKALLLLSHYDSSPHSSYGASDAGSGVVTILEGLRAFLSEGRVPTNDIIILITDAEELGLNGADLFVNKHEWAKDVGLVLNFEARGSGGPSYMLVETNGGNSKMMKGFVKANPQYPVANSLAYSIYKMLPNDTDLTRFREDGDIEGFNFAFIDDHYDYHTALDNYERLDRNSLEHQGSYLMPLLDYFSDANLSNLKSDEDYIYFNAPVVKTVIYPFSWIWPMLVLGFLIFGILVTYGFRNLRLNRKDLLKGFIPFLSSIVICTLVGFILWNALKFIYPHYADMSHGFTYNGHTYIWTFVMLSIGICFYIYSKFYKPGNTANLAIAPIFVWLLLCLVMALELPGASFFIVPVFFALLGLFVLINQRKPSLILMAIIAFPLVMIMSPFIKMFPVGLGLDILFVSALLVALVFGLLISIFGFFRHKKRLSYVMFFMAFCFLIAAHINSGFDALNPKPNSLVYMLDLDTNTAQWGTYDNELDDWTKAQLGDDPNEAGTSDVIASKYRSGITYTRQAPIKTLVYPEIEVFKDSIIGDFRHVSVYIGPQRNVNRMDLYADTQLMFKDFKINGIEANKRDDQGYAFQSRGSNRLFSYYVSNNEPLEFDFSIPKGQQTKFVLYESSNDLLTDRQFEISSRKDHMIPRPFVLNDAVIIKKTIIIE
ncbi:MAG: M28 family peptidase [Bacteroidia bacterium]|nr:M28 family peptidase [Bacteroidia bacterium]